MSLSPSFFFFCLHSPCFFIIVAKLVLRGHVDNNDDLMLGYAFSESDLDSPLSPFFLFDFLPLFLLRIAFRRIPSYRLPCDLLHNKENKDK